MSPVFIAISLIYGIVSFALVIILIIDALRKINLLQPYRYYGFVLGLIVLGVSILGIGNITNTSILVIYIIAQIFVIIKIIIFTMAGMHYSHLLEMPSFPILTRYFKIKYPVSAEMTSDTKTLHCPESDTIAVEICAPTTEVYAGNVPESIERTDPIKKIPTIHYIGIILTVVFLSILYSVILFLVTKPEITELAKKALGVNPENPYAYNFNSLILLGFVGFGEEIIFRLGIQNMLASFFKWKNKQYWLAIISTAILWSCGHIGTLNPAWVKLAQIFPVGIALGWLYKKYGIEACITVHMLFNIILVVMAPYLIKV